MSSLAKKESLNACTDALDTSQVGTYNEEMIKEVDKLEEELKTLMKDFESFAERFKKDIQTCNKEIKALNKTVKIQETNIIDRYNEYIATQKLKLPFSMKSLKIGKIITMFREAMLDETMTPKNITPKNIYSAWHIFRKKIGMSQGRDVLFVDSDNYKCAFGLFHVWAVTEFKCGEQLAFYASQQKEKLEYVDSFKILLSFMPSTTDALDLVDLKDVSVALPYIIAIAKNKQLVQTDKFFTEIKKLENPYNQLGAVIKMFDPSHTFPKFVKIYENQHQFMTFEKYDETDIIMALQHASVRPSLWHYFLIAVQKYKFKQPIDVSNFFFVEGKIVDHVLIHYNTPLRYECKNDNYDRCDKYDGYDIVCKILLKIKRIEGLDVLQKKYKNYRDLLSEDDDKPYTNNFLVFQTIRYFLAKFI